MLSLCASAELSAKIVKIAPAYPLLVWFFSGFALSSACTYGDDVLILTILFLTS